MSAEEEGLAALAQFAAGDEDEMRRLLERALAKQNERAPKTPLSMGPVLDYGDRKILVLHVLKPCKRGTPRGSSMFVGPRLYDALSDARTFAEAMTPCDEEEDDVVSRSPEAPGPAAPAAVHDPVAAGPGDPLVRR